MSKVNVNDVKDQALKEVEAERTDKAKKLYKQKLAQIADAEQIVNNLRRELDSLTHEIEEGVF